MKKSEKVNDIEKIYDAVDNEIADDELDCVAGGGDAGNVPPSRLEIDDKVLFKLHPWDVVSLFGKIVDKRYDGSRWEYKIKYTQREMVHYSDYVKETFVLKR